jgi:hypothetical protein
MKKAILLGVMAALIVCATANAAEWVNGSGNQSADAVIYVDSVNFHGMVVATDGTNACTVSVYDSNNSTTSGKTLLFPTTVVTTSSTDRVRGIYFSPPVKANSGIFVDITVGVGGSCNYVVYYSR